MDAARRGREVAIVVCAVSAVTGVAPGDVSRRASRRGGVCSAAWARGVAMHVVRSSLRLEIGEIARRFGYEGQASVFRWLNAIDTDIRRGEPVTVRTLRAVRRRLEIHPCEPVTVIGGGS